MHLNLEQGLGEVMYYVGYQSQYEDKEAYERRRKIPTLTDGLGTDSIIVRTDPMCSRVQLMKEIL